MPGILRKSDRRFDYMIDKLFSFTKRLFQFNA